MSFRKMQAPGKFIFGNSFVFPINQFRKDVYKSVKLQAELCLLLYFLFFHSHRSQLAAVCYKQARFHPWINCKFRYERCQDLHGFLTPWEAASLEAGIIAVVKQLTFWLRRQMHGDQDTNMVIIMRSTGKCWTPKVGSVRLQGELSSTHTALEKDD